MAVEPAPATAIVVRPKAVVAATASASTGWPSAKRIRSPRRSSAVAYRLSGSLAMAFMITLSRPTGWPG